MKANIHPTWYPDAKVTCACGNVFITGSTLPQIHVEICSNCHPLFTGQQKLIDTLGQVERFQLKSKKSEEKKVKRNEVIQRRAAKVAETKTEKPSLKDLLMQARKDLKS